METNPQSIAGAPEAMPSRAELTHAVQVAATLLEQLGLRDYRFSVEPREGPWQLKLQAALAGGWYELEVSVAREVFREVNEAHLVALREALARVGLPVSVQ